jgi:hypothetical protein
VCACACRVCVACVSRDSWHSHALRSPGSDADRESGVEVEAKRQELEDYFQLGMRMEDAWNRSASHTHTPHTHTQLTARWQVDGRARERSADRGPLQGRVPSLPRPAHPTHRPRRMPGMLHVSCCVCVCGGACRAPCVVGRVVSGQSQLTSRAPVQLHLLAEQQHRAHHADGERPLHALRR